MKAVVLAGGLGTRLRGVISEDIPKPMAPIHGRPFLEYLLMYLSRSRMTHVILSVGHKFENIKDYFGTFYFGMEISYSVEEAPLGTGGAIKYALDSISENKEHVLVLNGDTYFPIRISKFLDHHVLIDSDISLALKHLDDKSRYGVVELSQLSRIEAFLEKGGAGPGLINGGIYIMHQNFFQNKDVPQKFSFEEFLSDNVGKLHISGVPFEDYFMDMGLPEDYKKLGSELLNHL
ncbi:NTP transferase domain-containing protein [bacterium]|nr:NTP transferase domain-containing protein [bacterium]